MRAVWSFWSKPASSGRSGWASEFHHLLSWALSVETARRHFDELCLVADAPGARLLVDGLGLPFTEVSTALDALSAHDPELWALGKLHAYRAQPGPFLHVDSDVFLWEPPPPEWLDAAVCCAFPEHFRYGEGLYRVASLKAQLRACGGWMPEELDAFVPYGGMLRAENCGVVGGQHAEFLHYYAEQAIRLLDDPANQPAWQRRRPLADDMLVIEQHMLSACLDHHGVPVRYLFADWGEALRDGDARGFTHLLGGSKRDPALLHRLRTRVAADHPALYARAEALAS